MRERAATPIIRGKTERPLEGAFSLSEASEADARAARAELEHLLAERPGALPPRLRDALERYVALLLEANAHLNLTRVVEPAAVARLHLLDALAALPLVDELRPTRALDLGSGGGVPGIVLALARPDVRWTMVDAAGRKADALRAIAAQLGLGNVEVVAERAELLGRGPARESFDLVTARACAALPVLAEYALPLLAVGGTLVAWKGHISTDELAAGATASAELGGGVPEIRPTGEEALGEHRFVVVAKVGVTPDRYPRRPGQPARRPLG
jgi:16S rRNA (guanine527-N7)-methyltransferase